MTCLVGLYQSALCTSKNVVVVVVLSQSEKSELYITHAILSLFRSFPVILLSYWYILQILWLRASYIDCLANYTYSPM